MATNYGTFPRTCPKFGCTSNATVEAQSITSAYGKDLLCETHAAAQEKLLAELLAEGAAEMAWEARVS